MDPKFKQNDPWQETLQELKGTLTRATFNTHLVDSEMVAQDGNLFVVRVRNHQAVEWIEARLDEHIHEILSAVHGRTAQIRWVTRNGSEPEAVEEETEEDQVQDVQPQKQGSSPITGPEFDGFHPISSNYTTTPDLFFDVVVPNAHGGVTKVVAAVIRQTIGTFVDKRHNRRREEWAANKSLLARTAGISSRTTVQTALWDARADGYVIKRDVDGDEAAALSDEFGYPVEFTLRLRYQDEPADIPHRPRPGYGNKRQ